MCNTFLSVSKPCGPSAEYLKVLPAIEIASIYALTTGGKRKVPHRRYKYIFICT